MDHPTTGVMAHQCLFQASPAFLHQGNLLASLFLHTADHSGTGTAPLPGVFLLSVCQVHIEGPPGHPLGIMTRHLKVYCHGVHRVQLHRDEWPVSPVQLLVTKGRDRPLMAHSAWDSAVSPVPMKASFQAFSHPNLPQISLTNLSSQEQPSFLRFSTIPHSSLQPLCHTKRPVQCMSPRTV